MFSMVFQGVFMVFHGFWLVSMVLFLLLCVSAKVQNVKVKEKYYVYVWSRGIFTCAIRRRGPFLHIQ